MVFPLKNGDVMNASIRSLIKRFLNLFVSPVASSSLPVGQPDKPLAELPQSPKPTRRENRAGPSSASAASGQKDARVRSAPKGKKAR
ncbi:hypothetical protein ICW03_10115 [Polynucleobacter sp. MWH-Aus1W21]|nr:hypothetical protein ICW03_10115 [Polynucleobacter sp. MWH-Aus1W21]